MSDKLNLEVNGFGSINEANMELNKINIVGGVNSSGKSTVSRLLYCFLKAGVLCNENYIKQVLVDEIIKNNDSEEISLSYNDDFSHIMENYYEYICNSDDEKEIGMLFESIICHNNYFYSDILSSLIHIENVDLFEGYSKISNSNFHSFMGNKEVNAEFDEGGFVENYDKNEYDVNSDLYVLKTEGDQINIHDVYYIDNFSILDLLNIISLVKRRDLSSIDVIYPKNHIWYLNKDLSDEAFPNSRNDFDKKIINVFDKINYIINGIMRPPDVSSDFIFVDESKRSFDEKWGHNVAPACGTGYTSSGIKQFGIIYLLLLNGKLKPNTVLIFDEPEVNLHPKWQFKFAEILVLLVKDLDITLYLNSHSPTFIESIDAFADYYDMEDDVNYYLTEETEVKGKFDFNKINSDELYKIYSNLGNIYDDINKLRIRKRLKDRG